jgi:hypothetical protein
MRCARREPGRSWQAIPSELTRLGADPMLGNDQQPVGRLSCRSFADTRADHTGGVLGGSGSHTRVTINWHAGVFPEQWQLPLSGAQLRGLGGGGGGAGAAAGKLLSGDGGAGMPSGTKRQFDTSGLTPLVRLQQRQSARCLELVLPASHTGLSLVLPGHRSTCGAPLIRRGGCQVGCAK